MNTLRALRNRFLERLKLDDDEEVDDYAFAALELGLAPHQLTVPIMAMIMRSKLSETGAMLANLARAKLTADQRAKLDDALADIDQRLSSMDDLLRKLPGVASA
jgi:hypothetical protein